MQGKGSLFIYAVPDFWIQQDCRLDPLTVDEYLTRVNFDKQIKLLLVVVLFPILCNIFQFLVQDLILKMKNLHTSDYEIVCKYYETVLERESHYQEYNYFSKQTELSSLDDFKIIDAKY